MEELLAGRYRLDELIGRGGMGWVQLAVDSVSDRQVAIKFLRADDEPEKLATAFSWEVSAVARLAHRGIIPLYDFGRSERDEPFMVMGLSPGTPLHRVDKAAFDWPTLCIIMLQLFEILAHSHARGVFHHDLKPGNVLVYSDEDGVVRVQVIDFGIAGVLGHQSVGLGAGPTKLVGTASYLAPESVRAYNLYRFSPGPDLYAVGIMAYELAYGERPFVASEAREVLRMHQMVAPRLLPFREGMDAPEPLNFFIQKLLAKNPRERFGSATEAIDLLRQFAPSNVLNESYRNLELPPPRFEPLADTMTEWGSESPRDHGRLMSVRPTPFVGRKSEERFLTARLTESVMNRRPQVVLITAPSGVGKSRLTRQVAERAAETGHAKVSIAPYSLSRSDSLEGWRSVLLSLLGYTGTDRQNLERVLADDLRWLGLSGQIDVGTVLELLFPGDVSDKSESSDVGSDFDWVGTYLRLLTALARKRPLLIVLEDLHVADDARGVEVLEFLLRTSESAPITVILTMRSPALGKSGIAEDELKRLESYPSFVISRLEALDDAEMKALLNALMPLNDQLSQRVIKSAQGVPIFGVELLRYWFRTGTIELKDGRYSFHSPDVTLPGSVTEIWNARIDVMAEAADRGRLATELLQRAAVLGQPFTYSALRDVVVLEKRGDLASQLGSAWATWHAEGLCEQVTPGESLFAHHSLEEAAVQRVVPDQLRSIHHFCAQARLRDSAPTSTSGALSVARHFSQAGLPQEAFPFFIRAARDAYRTGRFPAAVTYCQRAAELLGEAGASSTDRRWAVLYRLLAESLFNLSRYADVEEIAWRLEERASRWSDRLHQATALRLVATARWRRGQTREAEVYLLQARDLFQSLGVHRELGRCELDLGELWQNQRAPEEIRERYRLARRHFGIVKDDRGIAQALLREGRLLREIGALEPAERYLSDAFSIFKRLSDRAGMAKVLRHRGRCALLSENPQRALDAFAEASQMNHAIGRREGVALCTLETGRAYRALSEMTQAERCFRTAREELIALGNRRRSIQAHMGLVQLAIDSRQYAASVPHLEHLLTEIQQTADLRTQMVLEVLISRCAAEDGRWPEADMSLCQAEEILSQLLTADIDMARQLKRIAGLAMEARQSFIAESAARAAIGIWRRLGRDSEIEPLRLLVEES